MRDRRQGLARAFLLFSTGVEEKPSTRTRLLLAAATLVSSLWAGCVVDRVVVGGPAWHQLGAEAWAAYGRQADLGNGLVAYPMEAI